MNLDKIDKSLLSKVTTFSADNNIECIVKVNNIEKTRKYFLHKKIKILHEYLFINSFKILVNKNQLFQISSLTSVSKIYSITSACTMIDISKKILGVDKTLLTGSGVTIAFIDTGVFSHADFLIGRNRIRFFKDFVLNKKHNYDDNGHGTFVAGVCSGGGVLSGGLYSGVAPQADIISLKALNGLGEASADKILDAMEWVYENHKKFNIKVVCMSFGSEPLGYNDPIMSGAEALWREGVTVVAAAGNSGPEYQTIKSPGVSSQIITVGGFDDNRIDGKFQESFFEIADFSSRGPAFKRFKPDLVAPSVDIKSCGISTFYTSLSGTSVATPMIAGIACLLLQAKPNLTPQQIKQTLISVCRPITLNHNFEGYGYPNLKDLI